MVLYISSVMEQESNSQPQSITTQTVVGIIWFISLVIVGGSGYFFGQASVPVKETPKENVLSAMADLSNTPVPSPTITPTIVKEKACSKTGLSQKWEYLDPYVIKEGDSLQSIIAKELGDPTRLSEVVQLNGQGQLMVGSTLYLPPKSISKSSGNIRQVNGRLIERDDSMWHISFNADKNGQGLLIPTFWFESLANKGLYNVGDCLTILFDEGYKVFSVTLQEAKK